ncbi:hypothetical protein [Dyella acidiphila]|uniref:Uncharacterized protein n=1 Tax=Dyella acidiphila TaxID=2775866 RepID=A0ABR9GCY7_9GAMM|nr:hypothetical protein [Dyella acidiphila]MBE1161901.1 hypothetical protein [Dyella acidiphila]
MELASSCMREAPLRSSGRVKNFQHPKRSGCELARLITRDFRTFKTGIRKPNLAISIAKTSNATKLLTEPLMKKLTFLIFLFATTTAIRLHAAVSEPESSSTSQIYKLEKCIFKIANSTGLGIYADGSYAFLENQAPYMGQGFPITCETDATQDKLDGLLAAKQINGQWIWAGTNAPFEPRQHFEAKKIIGANWIGISTAYDETTGATETRQRYFQYCLVETRGSQALCGHTSIGAAGTAIPALIQSRILSVLKTVEFIDQQPTSSTKPNEK